MNVLVDLNVLLDLFLNRADWVNEAAAVLEANHSARITVHVSAISLPTLFYIIRRKSGIPRALIVVDECLASLQIVPVSAKTLVFARTLAGSDYEDNIQIACAVEASVDAIVTRDPRGFANALIPALSPTDLLARLNGGTP